MVRLEKLVNNFYFVGALKARHKVAGGVEERCLWSVPHTPKIWEALMNLRFMFGMKIHDASKPNLTLKVDGYPSFQMCMCRRPCTRGGAPPVDEE